MNTLVAANLGCLGQGIGLLEQLAPELYRHRCPEIFNSTIGGHIRHSLDHYAALMDGLADGRVDYDARERDPAVESDPAAALSQLRGVMARLQILARADLDQPLRIRMDDGGDSSWSGTTLRRELQFLLSHTIHHYALIVGIAGRLGVAGLPQGFGVAPSTLHYRETAGA